MDVYCEICGKAWDCHDTGVRYHHPEGVWTCTDEGECFGRRVAAAPVCGAPSPGATMTCQRSPDHDGKHMASTVREWEW